MPVSIQLRFVEGKKKSKRKFCSMCVCKFRGKGGGGREGYVTGQLYSLNTEVRDGGQLQMDGKVELFVNLFTFFLPDLAPTVSLIISSDWSIDLFRSHPPSPSLLLVRSLIPRVHVTYRHTHIHSSSLSLSVCLSVLYVCKSIVVSCLSLELDLITLALSWNLTNWLCLFVCLFTWL